MPGSSSGQATFRGAGSLASGMVVAAVFGLLFQSLLSYLFGAGAETDAFFMSVSIFALLSKFLMLGQLKSIALPLFSQIGSEDPDRATHMLGGTLKAVLLGLAVFALLAGLAAPVLVRVFAPGFDAEASRLTASLLRIRVPALVFAGFVTLARIALETRSHFGVAVLVQKVVPAFLTFALLLWLGADARISQVAWVGLAGAGGGAALLLLLRPRLLRGSIGSALNDSNVREVGRGWLRFGQSTGATFVGEWAFRVGASLLPVGMFSAVLYGRMVHDVVHGAINDPATTVTLPQVSRAVEDGGTTGAGELLRTRVSSLVLITAPLAALLALLAPWLVAILFGRGRFLDDGMLGPTAAALAIFAVGFLVQGVNQILFTGAFATGASHLVNRVNLVGHLVRAVVLVPLVLVFGLVGLVGAQVAMNVLVLLLVLKTFPLEFGLRRGPGARRLWSRLARTLGATVLAVVLVRQALFLAGDPLEHALGVRLGVAAAATLGFFLLYSGLGAAMGLPVRQAVESAIRGFRARGMDPAIHREDASTSDRS